MALREIAGGAQDFFNAEKILKKQEKKLEDQRNRDYQRQKDAEKHDVFNFINTTLGDKSKLVKCIRFFLKTNFKFSTKKIKISCNNCLNLLNNYVIIHHWFHVI